MLKYPEKHICWFKKILVSKWLWKPIKQRQTRASSTEKPTKRLGAIPHLAGAVLYALHGLHQTSLAVRSTWTSTACALFQDGKTRDWGFVFLWVSFLLLRALKRTSACYRQAQRRTLCTDPQGQPRPELLTGAPQAAPHSAWLSLRDQDRRTPHASPHSQDDGGLPHGAALAKGRGPGQTHASRPGTRRAPGQPRRVRTSAYLRPQPRRSPRPLYAKSTKANI